MIRKMKNHVEYESKMRLVVMQGAAGLPGSEGDARLRLPMTNPETDKAEYSPLAAFPRGSDFTAQLLPFASKQRH
jgi:hypothetical protein